jgi:hypothetical protein
VADSDEAPREHVQQKAPDKLIGMHGQEPLVVVVSGIAPAERYGVVNQRNQAVVGNRDAMGVGAEVSEHLIGPSERRLTIDNPAQRVKLTDQAPEQSGLFQAANPAVELELPGSVSLLERCYEFPRKSLARTASGRKKRGFGGRTQWVRSRDSPPAATTQ